MGVNQHLASFVGLPVKNYNPKKRNPQKPGAKPVIYRLSTQDKYGEDSVSFLELFDSFLQGPAAAEATGLVIGMWGYEAMLAFQDDPIMGRGSDKVIEMLVHARGKLPKLRAIFLGDVIWTECEISWINQGDVSPLLAAYPKLEHFRVRGVGRLTFGNLNHKNLRSLTIESGGLPEQILAEVIAAQVPKLEHLELWLGTSSYGGIDQIEPLLPLLKTRKFRNLQYLGLRDSEIADQVAIAVSSSPLLNRIKILDLSLGNLTDVGVHALLQGQGIKDLEKLDIHHHFVSPPLVRSLKKLGIKVDASDKKEAETYEDEVYRYCAVAE